MAITADSQRPPSGALAYDVMAPYPGTRTFTNPWASSSSTCIASTAAPSSNPLSTMATTTTTAAAAHPNSSSFFPIDLDPFSRPSVHRSVAMSVPYPTMPGSAPAMSTTSMPVAHGSSEILTLSNHVLAAPRMAAPPSYGTDLAYATTAPSHPSPTLTHPSTSSSFDPMSAHSMPTTYPSQPAFAAPTLLPPTPSLTDDRRWSQPAMPSSANPSAGQHTYLGAMMDQARPRQASVVDLDRTMPPPPPTMSTSTTRDDLVDALQASRGMLLMNDVMDENHTTPRNIFDLQGRDPLTNSYGFPHTAITTNHSSNSSVSSNSPYPSYYPSMDSSLSDYGSTSESMDAMSSSAASVVSAPSSSSRAWSARPSISLSGNTTTTTVPPGPQSMMSQFNSKVSSSAQKKHRCKICDKRFTRPSSLRTHMYSHTGEKREYHLDHHDRSILFSPTSKSADPRGFLAFLCDVDGCGRYFSVVSNLRRHRKVHRGGVEDREVSSAEEC